MSRAAFAIPGDITTVTGGYLYERRLLEELRARGTDILHVRLAASFPNPTDHDQAEAVAALRAVDADRPLLVDGLVFGSIDTAGLASVRAPLVAMIHHPLALESGLDPARRDHLWHTERDNLRLVRAVAVPSPHTARILTAEYEVDPELITIARPGTRRAAGVSMPAADPPLILSVGIQHPRKGHDVLLRALARLQDRAWQAVIVGSPYDRDHADQLQRLHGMLGLGPRVRLAGLVDDVERDRLYGTASLFALATRYEGYGLVFDEALMHGLPIVSCRTGAVPDTVPADAGLLVPPDDPVAIADALAALLDDPARRRAMAAASALAGSALPEWSDTAAIVQGVLDSAR